MVLKHIHTYKRLRKGLYKCNDPYCSQIEKTELLIDKASVCNTCDNEIILTRKLLQKAAPRCLECSDTKEARLHRQSREIMNNLGVI